MPAKKPWTVMVYLAADNNLKDFGVFSLQQMKAAANENINVLAEFDTGPAYESKRFHFKGEDPYASINDDLVQIFRPANSADPDNLVDFIRWGAAHYPAHHYFVIVWGHGAGVDDAFPRANDATFVSRHNLLSLTKGTLDVPMKGTLDVPMKGTLDVPMKGTLDVPMKGTLDVPMKGTLDVPMKGALESPMKDAIGKALSSALQQGVAHALDEEVLGAVSRGLDGLDGAPLTAGQSHNLNQLKAKLLPALHEVVLNRLQRGTLASLRQSVTDVVTNTVLDALGSILELQKKVLAGLSGLDSTRMEAMVGEICGTVERDLFYFLENRISGAVQATAALADTAQKSLAFVDHPAGYLSNLDLRNALAKASALIGGKIDVFGMDACNMNMAEIGYELRDSVSFMVASQDHIPDASWPYDRILSRLVKSPKMKPRDLARVAAIECVTGYQDCIDTSVTMSVLDLKPARKVAAAVKKLADRLITAMKNPDLRPLIDAARRQTRSFGLNEFADFCDFCACLESVLKRAGVEPHTQAAAKAAVAPFAEFIAENRFSSGEQNCNGTSVCFPQFDLQRAEHLIDMVGEYEKLDFARDTGWHKLIAKFLEYQRQQAQVALALVTPPPVCSQETHRAAGAAPAHPRSGLESPLQRTHSPAGSAHEHAGNGHPGNGHSTHGHQGRNI